ncbi:O-methyltransferase ZRP4 [Acorus calamus]|uniref:O-methyltransferase ZRP4 n=1 Tax=Acorus calamus TaxID=4465 RepID=A0AAV9FGE4_ACOCL|nr:O-methyltransferase ZRP4 [Acorus calamus]
MRMLVFTGCFANVSKEGEEEKYVLTPVSRLLVKDKDTGVLPFLFFENRDGPGLAIPLSETGQVVPQRPVDPVRQGARGGDIRDGDAVGESNRLFNEAMACNSRPMAKALVEKHHDTFVGVKSFVDIGGGTGSLAAAIAKAFPWIKCAMLDLPHVVADAPKDGVVEFVVGNMFEHVPSEDTIIL